MSATSAPITYAPPALWVIARAFIVTFFALFGEIEDIAEQHLLSAKAYRLTLKWLRAGEALMRRLLLIEAAHYDKPNTRPLPRKPRQRERKLMYFQTREPEAWPVSFRCFVEHQRSRPRIAGGLRMAKRFYSAWPLAERAEAMLRVFNNPAPYAKRLARRLYAGPHRSRSLLSHPPNAPDLIGRESFAQTEQPCESAVHHFEPG